MADKYRKIERQYVLSDSSVNEYGFRLLTSGYQLESYQKNPIGYYMHRRDDGIVLKWEGLEVTGDTIVGYPVINLSNPRGEQICNEAENGFLNAASVGHIVVLEYSTDPQLMLPGQTGPTITRWYNKECSLVDIPGNGNALTKLYDAQENEINLVDLAGGLPGAGNMGIFADQVCSALQLAAGADQETILCAARALADRNNTLSTEVLALRESQEQLQTQLASLTRMQNEHAIAQLLQRALEDSRITVELKTLLAADYSSNPDGLSALLAAMPAYRSISEMIKTRTPAAGESEWLWDDFEKNDPSGNKLKDLRTNDPTRYQELFDKKFAA